MSDPGTFASTLVGKWRLWQHQPRFLLVQSLLGKIPGHPLRVARFFQLTLTDPRQRNLRGFGRLRRGVREDVPGMCVLENKREIFLKRFGDGEECVIACDGERIIGYAWFTGNNFHLEERFGYRLAIAADAIYAYDAFIDPGYRMRGVWVLFQKRLLEEAKQLGRSRITVIVDYGNDSSLKAHLRFGYCLEREVTVAQILGRRFFRVRVAEAGQPAVVPWGSR